MILCRRGLIFQVFTVFWLVTVTAGYLLLQAPYTMGAIVTWAPSLTFLVAARDTLGPWFAADYKK